MEPITIYIKNAKQLKELLVYLEKENIKIEASDLDEGLLTEDTRKLIEKLSH